MSIQILPDEFGGSISGRLGKGLGRALSEQVPKEVERLRLSSGLKKFEKESQSLTPIQQFTKLAAIPGITPEHLYTIAPLLRQQMQREEGGNIAKGMAQRGAQQVAPTIGSQAAQGGTPPFKEAEEKASENLPLKPLSATQAQYTPVVKKTPQELFAEAAALSQQNPYTYPTPQDALPIVTDAENTRISNLEEQRRIGEVADSLQSRIKERLQNIWGKENTQKGIEDTIQTKLARKIEADLANPKNRLSEQQLIDKYGEVGKRIAQAHTNLLARANTGWFSGGWKPKKVRDTIKEVRRDYEAADSLEEFQDIIQNQFNLSSGEAARFAYPPENKKINSAIEKISPPFRSEKGTVFPGQIDEMTLKVADAIVPLLTSEDSLATYAREIQKKGLNADLFFDRLNQLRDQGIFKPNSRQRLEIQKRIPAWPAPGDILYSQ